MNKKNFLLTVLVLLFSPQLAMANVITPLSVYTIPLLPLIISIEAAVFWLLANKVIKIQINSWKIIRAVLVANVITSVIGSTFIPLNLVLKFFPPNYNSDLIWIGVAFILSVLIEWGIYVWLSKKVEIKASSLLGISFMGNIITYASLIVFRLI